MKNTVIWSNFEVSPFMQQEAKKIAEAGGPMYDLSKAGDLTALLKRVQTQNIAYLNNVIKPTMNKPTETTLIAFCIVDSPSSGRRQDAFIIESNMLSSIFDIPFDYGTWLMDTWNLKATVYYNGDKYSYTFRQVKETEDVYRILENIKTRKLMLTGTYLSNVTRTLLNK